MTALKKAQLGEITSGDSPTEVDGTLVDVQFNPTSLRVQIANRTAGGQQAGAQARQRPGTGEMQVSFDLVFDTADEGETDNGVNVLEKTKTVERFVRPKGNRAGEEAPPRVIFKWGSFVVQGTMESANIDLDLFDAQGVPLRAKVSVTIKGQDPRWTYTPAPNPQQPPAGSGTGVSQLPPGAPGTVGSAAAPERIMQAMPGEGLAQLAQRAGLDPAAWRALADGLGNPLSLSLGAEIALPASMAKGSASASATYDPGQVTAALPLVGAAESGQGRASGGDLAGNARAATTDPVRKGQALAARGGVEGAIDGVKRAVHQQGVDSTRQAFGLSAAASAEIGSRPWGAGVPLRPRISGGQGPVRRDPTEPAWAAVPAQSSTSSASNATRQPVNVTAAAGCGCRDRRRPR